ncbi:hypothetical protein MASR2M39_20800 [Ignavibacteriales bacterium]
MWSEIPNPDVTGVAVKLLPVFLFFIITTPRGCALHILRPFFMVKGKWTRLNNSNSKIPTSIYGITVYREQVYLATSEEGDTNIV